MGYAEAQYTADELLAHLDLTEGSGLPPTTMDCSVQAGINKSINCYFLPSNTVIDGNTLCIVKGVRIVASSTGMPENIYDGEITADVTDNVFGHSSDPYVLTVPDYGTWYVRYFPYSDQNVYNYSDEHKFQVVVSPSVRIASFQQDFTNLDPTASITYTGENAGFTPMMTNASKGTVTYGDWMDRWPWLQKIKPYMVKNNGQVDYALNPNDYTQKADGSASDVSNMSYNGAGAFAWIPRLYSKVVQTSANNRTVYFSEEKIDSSYKANGFIDRDGNEMEGVWLPMFFTSTNFKSIAGSRELDFCINKRGGYVFYLEPTGASYATYTINSAISAGSDNIKTYFDNLYGAKRYAYLGGVLLDVLRDVLFLLYKSPDMSHNNGTYAAITDQYGKTYAVSDIVDGGIFYGQNRSASSLLHNKFFHSIVLGGHRSRETSSYSAHHLYLTDPMLFRNVPSGTNTADRFGVFRATRYLEVNEPGDLSSSSDGYYLFIQNNLTTGLLEKLGTISQMGIGNNTCYTPADSSKYPIMFGMPGMSNGSTTTGLCAPAVDASTGLSTTGSGNNRSRGTFTVARCAKNYVGSLYAVTMFTYSASGFYNCDVFSCNLMLLPKPGYKPE